MTNKNSQIMKMILSYALFMKRIMLFLSCSLFFLYGNNLNGQTVITDWAYLTAGSWPWGITVDAAGNVYTANSGNNTVSKITASGSVTAAWATLAANAGPWGIVTDLSGNIYTTNDINATVSKITSTGTVTQSWAILTSGSHPRGIVMDAFGNIYTANQSNSTISKITSSGVVTQAWATLAYDANPRSVAIDAAGNIYTANQNQTVSKITSSGVVTQAWATLASSPYGIVIDGSGNVYVSNYTGGSNSSISKISSSGVLTQTWVTLAGTIIQPQAMAIDLAGNIYVGTNLGNVMKVSKLGSAIAYYIAYNPVAIATDASGNVYTANYNNVAVSKITASTLPIKLFAFTASLQKDNKVLLGWQTATEINTDYFEVQHSSDGIHFTDIDRTAAAGNSTTLQSYQYTDDLSVLVNIPAAVYYRLRETDKDGSINFSNIVSVKPEEPGIMLKVMPNPVQSTLNIAYTSNVNETLLLKVFDMGGRMIMQKHVNAMKGINDYELPFGNMAHGTYLLQVTGSENGIHIIKVVKGK
jgi:streptogramin lyase